MKMETYRKVNELMNQHEQVKDLLRQIRCVENESYMTFGNYSGDRRVSFSGENKKVITKAMKNALEERLKELEEEIERL